MCQTMYMNNVVLMCTWGLITAISEVCRGALHIGACEVSVTFMQTGSLFLYLLLKGNG